jgi:hypothetical protein
MTIPPEISVLIDRLNQELDWAEQEATEGLNLARAALSRFPNNALLIQFFAYFNSVLLFVETYKRPTQNTVKRIMVADVTRMKQLPDEHTLFELLEMAKIAEQKARETSELATEIAYKWQKRLEGRKVAKHKAHQE